MTSDLSSTFCKIFQVFLPAPLIQAAKPLLDLRPKICPQLHDKNVETSSSGSVRIQKPHPRRYAPESLCVRDAKKQADRSQLVWLPLLDLNQRHTD